MLDERAGISTPALTRAKVLAAGARAFRRRLVPSVDRRARVFNPVLRRAYFAALDLAAPASRRDSNDPDDRTPSKAEIAGAVDAVIRGPYVEIGVGAGIVAAENRKAQGGREKPRSLDLLWVHRGATKGDAAVTSEFFVDPDELAAEMRSLEQRFVTRISSTLWQSLRESIAEGIQLGESSSKIEKRVLSVFTGHRRNSYTVARTEVSTAVTRGQRRVYEAANIRRKSWLSLRDPFTRITHLENDADSAAEGIPWDEAFSANGLMAPLDPAGDPGEVINCRCSLLPRGIGEDQEVFNDLAASGQSALEAAREAQASGGTA